jgi:hypothetical protein
LPSDSQTLNPEFKGESDEGLYEEDDEEADADGELEPEEGHEFVYADAVADFEFPFQVDNIKENTMERLLA